MRGLRWTLGVVTAVAAGAWVGLAIGGGAFRRSFGGSGNPVWVIALPVLAAGLVIASLVWPDRRALLHAAAALIVALAVASLLLARETAFVATLGVLYAAAWLWYYARVLRP